MRARPGLLLLLTAALSTGCLGAVGVLDAPAAPAAELPGPVAEAGDEFRFHHRVFDQAGRLLFSSRAEDRPLLEATRASWTEGLFVLPPEGDQPSLGVVDDGRTPFRFPSGASVPVGQALHGKGAGFVAAFPVVGRVTGYEEAVTLPRLRGPFPQVLDVSLERLDASGFDAGADEVALDDALVGKVVHRNATHARLRFDVEDGGRFVVRNAELGATLDVDEAASAFSFRLGAEPGHAFALVRGCALGGYVLDPGSYRVLEVTEDDIRLERSPTRYPQFIGRDLVLIIEIVEVLK